MACLLNSFNSLAHSLTLLILNPYNLPCQGMVGLTDWQSVPQVPFQPYEALVGSYSSFLSYFLFYIQHISNAIGICHVMSAAAAATAAAAASLKNPKEQSLSDRTNVFPTERVGTSHPKVYSTIPFPPTSLYLTSHSAASSTF